MLREQMTQVEVTPMNLLAMAKRIFRGKFENAAVRGVEGRWKDWTSAILKAAPRLGRYCGEVVVVGRK